MAYIIFGLYFFEFMIMESFVNSRAALLLGPGLVNEIYGFGLLCTAGGFLMYAKFGHVKRTYSFSIIVALITALTLICTQRPYLGITAGLICLISLGYWGGLMHESLLDKLQDAHFGIHLGTCCAAAIFLQFLLEQSLHQAVLHIAAVLISASFFLWYTLLPHRNMDIIPNEFSPLCADNSISFQYPLWTPLSMVIIMSIILGLQDNILVYRNALGEVSLFSCIRLLYSAGLIIAGLVLDLSHGKALPILTACACLLSVAATCFMILPPPYMNISMGLMYFYSGFYVMFLTTVFIWYARNRVPASLWCGMGRITRCVTTAASVFIFILIGTHVTIEALILTSSLLGIGNILVCILGGMVPTATPAITLNDNSENEITDAMRLAIMSKQYHLTKREQDVLMLLMVSDNGVQEIADELNISRRVLQRHVASIYLKTGTETRLGVYRLWSTAKSSSIR